MRNQTTFVTLSVCATVITTAAILATAGPLTPPPGPVASTGVTLTGIEPRIAVNAANTPGDNDATPSLFKITQPGSYYFESNITGVPGSFGIEITASGVTIDLNGFELAGVPGSFDGVVATLPVSNLRIHNGSVREWAADGVNAGNAGSASLENLSVSGCGLTGMRVGASGVVVGCTAQANGGIGISVGPGSTVSGCTAQSNGSIGIVASNSSTISGCAARFNGSTGIAANVDSTISVCTASNNTGDGVSAGVNSMVSGCTVSFNGANGVRAAGESVVVGNACSRNGGLVANGAGVLAAGADVRIEGNNVVNNDVGVSTSAGGCFIVKNSASGNTTNYDLGATDVIGAIFDLSGGGVIRDVIGGGNGVISTPWANFIY